ncbi:hypothetical protein RWX45_00355, partial [Actinomyces sp. MRS3W]|nr:hypothetical protein [Actinomyces sp. MRS3W]
PAPAPDSVPSAESTAPSDSASETTPAFAGGVLARLRRRSTARAATDTQEQPAAAPSQIPADATDEAPAPAARPATTAAPSAAQAGVAPSSIESSPARPDAKQDQEEDEEERRVNRTTTAVLIAVLVAVLVGVFFAVNNLLGLAGVKFQDDDIPAAKTVPTTAAATSQEGEPQQEEEPEPTAEITLSSAQSLDPFGDNNEHPENAGLVIDGNTDQEWSSRYYYESSLAWKQGIGMAVALEQEAQVSGIDIQGTGTGGNVQVRATSPEDPTGGTLLAEGAFTEGTTSFDFDATTAQSIVLWVTDLPTAADGQFKVTITEITLK